MGTRGPKPRPTKEKKRLGNPGRRPLNDREPEPTGAPEQPDYLDDYAKQVWGRIVIAMAQGVYTACDEQLLAAYCVASSMFRRAVRINSEIDPLPEDTGVRDWIRVQKEQSTLLATLGTRLGLDPSARTAIKVPEQPKTGKFGQFKQIAGGRG